MRRGQGRGSAVCDPGQPAVEAPPQRNLATDVTHATGARDGLSPMALPATAGRGCPCEAGAAAGSSHGEAVKTCQAAGITPSVARPLTAANQQRGLFSPEDVTDERATETDQCPAGERRTCRCATVERGRPRRDDATSAGNAWTCTSPCPRNQGGRRLTRGVDEPRWKAMEPRVRRRPEVRKPRKPLVEHPFGTRQRGWAQGFLWMRWLAKGRTECRLTVWAYHLRRVVNRGGLPRRMAARSSVRVRGLSQRTRAVRAGSARQDVLKRQR